MNLTALGQRLLSRANELFDSDGGEKNQALNAANVDNNALQRYGVFNFATGSVNNLTDNGSATKAASDTALQRLAEQVKAQTPPRPTAASQVRDEPYRVYIGSEDFTVVLTAHPTASKKDGKNVLVTNEAMNREIADKIILQLGYTARDVEAYKKANGGVDPRAAIYNSLKINEPLQNGDGTPIRKADELPSGGYKIAQNGVPRRATEPLREFLKQQRTVDTAEYERRAKLFKENASGIIARDTAAQIAPPVKKAVVPVALLMGTQIGRVATLEEAALASSPLTLPSFGELAAQAGAGVKTAASNAATNLGTAAEAAPPVLMVTAGALGVKAAVEQYLHGQFEDKLLDVARHNRERVVETPLPPLEFPPAPPFAPPPSIDQTGKVKTTAQTTSPLAPPTTTTQLQGKSSEALRLPAPSGRPVLQTQAQDFIFLSKQAEILAKNMAAAGMGIKPVGFAAHHLIPFSDGRHEEYNDARDIMAKYGINLNDAVNGVYLPHKSDNYIGGMYHPKIHTKGYALEVRDRLQEAEAAGTTFVEKKQNIEDALQKMRQDLMNHTFPIDRKE